MSEYRRLLHIETGNIDMIRNCYGEGDDADWNWKRENNSRFLGALNAFIPVVMVWIGLD
jgi:hypothetical protein